MKTLLAVVCLALVALCYAQDDGAYAPAEGEEYDTVKKEQKAAEKAAKKEAEKAAKEAKKAEASRGTFVYNGRFVDGCDEDGLYYRDQASFVICSGQRAYVQPCAKGSANPDPALFQVREPYTVTSFCSEHTEAAPYFRAYPARPFYRGYRGFF